MRILFQWDDLPPLPWTRGSRVSVLAALSGGVTGGEGDGGDEGDDGGADDDASGGDAGGDSDDGGGRADDAAKDRDAVARARAETLRQKERADGLEKQIDALKKTATKEQKDAVAELEKELEEMRAGIKDRDAADRDRVNARLSSLPDAPRKKLEAVKDEIPLVALEKLIDAETTAPAPGDKRAPKPAPGGGPSRSDDNAEPVPRAVVNALRKAGRRNAASALDGMEYTQRNDGDFNRWAMPMDALLDDAEHRSNNRFSVEPPKGMTLGAKDLIRRGASVPTKTKPPEKRKGK